MITALIWAGTALAAVALVTIAALKAWRGWLDLQLRRLAADRPPPEADPTPAARIEMADVRERLRRLEAIATGVDL
jgi:hypothetical protein